MKKYDVAIIGAGTAGLTARSEVAKKTDNYVVVDGGILGTTCARVGCMPSKALIEVANTIHKQKSLSRYGIGDNKIQKPDYRKVMAHVRRLRDRFAGGVVKSMQPWKDHFIPKNARFLDANTLDLADEKIEAEKIIIATGSKPQLPEKWEKYSKYMIDTDRFFELETLPEKIAVFGLGPIGIELGQALTRLGIDVTAMIRRKVIGGLTDPDIQAYAFQCFADEMNIQVGSFDIENKKDQSLAIKSGGRTWQADLVLQALGRRPVLEHLGIEHLGVELNRTNIPLFDETTLQVGDLPVFIAGDVNGVRPVLHEAADEGRIAGHNAMAESTECFKKRTALHITFSSPNICVVGQSYAELKKKNIDFVVGRTSYEHQGRAMIMGENKGMINIYGDRKDGRLLGVEMAAPAGEHMAHLLALAIADGMTAQKLLSMPFYHPVLEEALRTALRNIVKQSRAHQSGFEFPRCEDTPVS